MRIGKRITLTLLSLLVVVCLFAQPAVDSLFGTTSPLRISFAITINEIRHSKNDSILKMEKLYYQRPFGLPDSVQVGLKSRGNFRLSQCYFPPLWIKITKSHAKGTIFEGNKKIKLVMPCYDKGSSNTLIVKEYLCYKLYEQVTSYALQTRLVDLNLTVRKSKNRKTTSKLKAILIEDVDKAAKRLDCKALPGVKIVPSALNDTNAARFELFQFMISNTDWSVVMQHNAKLLVEHNHKYISIAYDFDMSGLVDAPYAVVSHINGEKLNAERVTERIFRGYCHSPELIEWVRQEFLAKKVRLLATPDQLSSELSPKEIARIKDYLQEFFTILSNDRQFKINILDQCRPI